MDVDGTGRMDGWVVVGLDEAEGFVGGAVVVETIVIFVEVVVVVGVKGVNEESSGGTGLGFEKKFLLEN